MCGIVGYIGENVEKILLERIKPIAEIIKV